MALFEIVSYDFSIVENPLSDGGNFTAFPPSPLPAVPSAGVCEPLSSNQFFGAQYTGRSWPDDQYSEFTISGDGNINAVRSLIARWSAPGFFYYFQLTGNLTNSMYAFIGGVQHSIGQVSIPHTRGDTFRLTVETGVNSNIITISKNGTPFASFVDTVYYATLTAGTPGFGLIALQLVPPGGVTISRWAGGGPCQLEALPASLSFSADLGGANPPSQDVTVTNTGGGGSIDFSIFPSQSWMSFPVTAGSTPDTLPLSVDITGLTGGTYTGTILFTSPCGSSVTILVILTIIDNNPCNLTVSPTEVDFTAPYGGDNPDPRAVRVNAGPGGTQPFVVTPVEAWITVNETSGTTDEPIVVGVDIGGLAAGSYSGTVVVNSAQFGGAILTVNLTVTSHPGCAIVKDGDVISTYISDLSLNITPATALYTNLVPTTQIEFYETTNEGRNAIVLDFNAGDGLYGRDLGTIFAFAVGSHTVLYQWQPTLIDLPEGIYGRSSDWDDAGHPGNKFIQGVVVEADSFNNPKTFFLQDSDTLELHTLYECPATFNQQSTKSFSCTPFLAHLVRVVSSDGVEWRVWNSRIVFQPWPETNLLWQTEKTSLGLVGWGHVREMNIAHVSTSDLTLTLTFDSWPTITLAIPNSNGVQNKTKVTLPPNKFKLIGLKISSCSPFFLFEQDIELKLGEWGRQGSYQVLKPFGGQSRTGAIV